MSGETTVRALESHPMHSVEFCVIGSPALHDAISTNNNKDSIIIYIYIYINAFIPFFGSTALIFLRRVFYI